VVEETDALERARDAHFGELRRAKSLAPEFGKVETVPDVGF
jgi:hypothetical protein